MLLSLQVLIVITDGKQTKSKPYTDLKTASQGIKSKGVTVIAVGVGRGADESELQKIATSKETVFVSSSFKEIMSLAPPIRGIICDCKYFVLTKW